MASLNIVLVVVDSLRRDSLGAFNPAYGFTPRLDERLAGWHKFDRCYGSAPWTLPAISSILSGIDASRHGRYFHEGNGFEVTHLLPAGYRKIGVVNNPNLEPGSLGFQSGFDEYHYLPPADWEAPFARACEAIRGGSDGNPFFLFFHTNLPHDYMAANCKEHYEACFPDRRDWFRLGSGYLAWTDQTASERRRIRSLYDACVHRLDAQLSRLVDAVDRDSTVVCITGDHGEGFDYDLGRIHHGGRVHDDLINVPLCFHLPPSTAPALVERMGRRRSDPVASTDIVPTLLELAGQPQASATDGRSIASTQFDPSRVITSEDRRYLYLPSRERLNVNRDGKGTTRAARMRNRVLGRTAARHHNLKAFIQGPYKLIVTSFSPPSSASSLVAPAIRRMVPVGSTLLRVGPAWVALELFDVSVDPEEVHNLFTGRTGTELVTFLAERMPMLQDMTVFLGDRERGIAGVIENAVDGS